MNLQGIKEEAKFLPLEDILEAGVLTKPEMEHYCFDRVGEMHNDNEVYANHNYTVVLRDIHNCDTGYKVRSYWSNQR